MKKKNKAGSPTNFRLSSQALNLLNAAAEKSDLTKTQIVEVCVLRHALEVPELAQMARAALSEIASKNLQANGPKQK